MFFIINSLYRGCRPMIITTSLKLAGLKNLPDLVQARINTIFWNGLRRFFLKRIISIKNAGASIQNAKDIANRTYG